MHGSKVRSWRGGVNTKIEEMFWHSDVYLERGLTSTPRVPTRASGFAKHTRGDVLLSLVTVKYNQLQPTAFYNALQFSLPTSIGQTSTRSSNFAQTVSFARDGIASPSIIPVRFISFTRQISCMRVDMKLRTVTVADTNELIYVVSF